MTCHRRLGPSCASLLDGGRHRRNRFDLKSPIIHLHHQLICIQSINQSLAFQLHCTRCSDIFSNFFSFCSLFRSTLFTVRCFPFSFFPLPASCQRIIESQHSAPLQANKKKSRVARRRSSQRKNEPRGKERKDAARGNSTVNPPADTKLGQDQR